MNYSTKQTMQQGDTCMQYRVFSETGSLRNLYTEVTVFMKSAVYNWLLVQLTDTLLLELHATFYT